MVTVETCWGPRKIQIQTYWHLVPSSGVYAEIFCHNVHIGKGALLSVSAGIEAEREIENAQTGYSLAHRNDEKERVFEEVRGESFPARPSRLKALYVFDDESFSKRAQQEWFADETKVAHECHALARSIIHHADTFWLNAHPDQWRDYANKYWSGEMSENPFPEVLIHGALYFPYWQQLPAA